ncbi:MAG: F0F1 ATP synthase subunit B [Candidatus Andersenbacteria bacterium]
MNILFLFTLVASALETAPAAVAPAAGIGALGLDARALAFQVVNFGILLLLLRRFAYRPILNVLEHRRATIEESLRSANTIAQEKQSLVREKQAVLREAQTQAQAIVSRSQQQAGDIVRTAETEARRRAEKIFAQAKAKITQEENIVRSGLKKEALYLVAEATEKIIDQKLDSPSDAALIKRALQEVQAH